MIKTLVDNIFEALTGNNQLKEKCTSSMTKLIHQNVIAGGTDSAVTRLPPCAHGLVLSSWLRKRKKGFVWIASSPWSHRSPSFWTRQSYVLSSNWIFECNFRLLIIQWSLLCPPYQVNGYEPWARNSMLVTCNACSTKISTDSCRVSLKSTNERKTLLTKCSVVIYGHKNWFLSTMELTFLLDVPMKLNKRGCFSTADWKYTCFVLETCLQI